MKHLEGGLSQCLIKFYLTVSLNVQVCGRYQEDVLKRVWGREEQWGR